MGSQYDLFKDFAKSFSKHQDRWLRVFGGKLTIEEQNNHMIRFIQHNLSLYRIRKQKVVYAVYSYFGPTLIPTITELIYHFDDEETILTKLLSIMKNPYEVGKIALILRNQPGFEKYKRNSQIMASVAGLGGIDGAMLVVGKKKEHFESYFHIISLMINKEEDTEILSLFLNDYLLLEDFLCEFHMFYRLFKPGYKELTPSQVIELINEDKIDKIELSEYKESDLPYDEFQKQYILDIIYKGENT